MRETGRAQVIWGERLRAQTLIRTDELGRRTSQLRREVLFLSSLPAVSNLADSLGEPSHARAGDVSAQVWMQRLSQIYSSYFELEPDTLRVSLIGIADGGRELLAVERTSIGAVRVPPGRLRSAADQPYFRPAESPVSGSTELHALRMEGVPVLGVSAPVRRPDGSLFGYVVMEVDTRGVLAALVTDLPHADQMFISDEQCDFLVRYDGRDLQLADAPERAHWHEFMAAQTPVSAAVSSESPMRSYLTARGESLELMSARVVLDPRDPAHTLTLGVAVPERTIMSQVDQVRYSVAAASTLGLLLIGGLAVWYRYRQARDHMREARLAAIVTSSVDAIIAKRLDGVVVDWNPGAEAMFGYSSAEAIGRPLGELIVPPGYEHEESEILDQIACGQIVPQRETVRRRSDGGLLNVSITVSPILTPRGEIIGAAKTVRDITLRKRAEETLKKSRAQLSIFVEHSLASIAMFDNDMRYLAYSNAWLNQFGKGRASLLGLDHYKIHPRLPEHWLQAHRRGLQGHSSGAREQRWIDSHGREHWGSWMVMPWLDESGGIGGIIISGEDLSELKQGEAERERLLGELRELNVALEGRVQQRTEELSGALREREILLQEMHHRVKNNLQVISSLIRMQMRQIPAGDSRDALEDCQARIQAIALIHEKLYQTKNYASIAISDYVSEMAQSVFRASGHGPERVRLSLELEKVSLPVDRAIPCGLILNELISNALKHAFPRDRQGTVRVVVQRAGDNVVLLAVSDDGIGLSEDADVLASHTLGLQLVQTLTRQLDGSLEISGRQGMSVRIEFTV